MPSLWGGWKENIVILKASAAPAGGLPEVLPSWCGCWMHDARAGGIDILLQRVHHAERARLFKFEEGRAGLDLARRIAENELGRTPTSRGDWVGAAPGVDECILLPPYVADPLETRTCLVGERLEEPGNGASMVF